MSDVVFKCPHCGQKLRGEESDAGAETECPTCGSSFILKVSAIGSAKQTNAFMCYIGIFKRYFDFKSRMRRRDFWWAFVFWWIIYILSAIVDLMIWGELCWCVVVVLCGTFIPLAAAQIRRLHDTNKSGWWLPLILLCPINIAYFVWLASDGDRGCNRFGPDPREW